MLLQLLGIVGIYLLRKVQLNHLVLRFTWLNWPQSQKFKQKPALDPAAADYLSHFIYCKYGQNCSFIVKLWFCSIRGGIRANVSSTASPALDSLFPPRNATLQVLLEWCNSCTIFILTPPPPSARVLDLLLALVPTKLLTWCCAVGCGLAALRCDGWPLCEEPHHRSTHHQGSSW